MERKRAYLEIARDILEVAKTGNKPTALVYGANLNFNIIKGYLLELEASGLIRVDDLDGGSRIYTTTERGLIFMESLAWATDIYPGVPPDPVQEAPVDSIAKEG